MYAKLVAAILTNNRATVKQFPTLEEFIRKTITFSRQECLEACVSFEQLATALGYQQLGYDTTWVIGRLRETKSPQAVLIEYEEDVNAH